MTTEQAIRAALEQRAAYVGSEPMSGPALRGRANDVRRVGWRNAGAALVAVAGVVAVLLAVPTVLRGGATPSAASRVDTWQPRGDLANDEALAAAARRAWESAPAYRAELPRRDVHVLLATSTELGRYVVLTGVNAQGHRRLAVFSDDPRDHAPYRGRLRLRRDAAFPKGPLLTYQEQRQSGSRRSVLLLVVAPPDVNRVTWRATDSKAPWAEAPSSDGVAAFVTTDVALTYDVRAYRENGRRLTGRTDYAFAAAKIYAPDKAVLLPGGDDGHTTECHRGVCTDSISGTVTATPIGPGTVTSPDVPGTLINPGNAPEPWEDMSDQAEMLWLNYGAQRRPLTQWGGGEGVSALLPDGTGVLFATRTVNGGASQAVLYVDRPEWPIGRLYLAAPDSDQRLRAVSVVVPTADGGRQLVVLAARGVTVRYRLADGAWRALDVSHVVAAARLPAGADPRAVRIEYTFAGASQVLPPDGVEPLPLP
jgi:hypothetical protein